MPRPTKYKKEFAGQAAHLCALGAIDKDLARFFKVTEKTLNNWKEAHPEFLQSIQKAKANADSRVQQALYERAIGYTHPEERIFCSEGRVTKVPTVKHYPPDTAAAFIWLKNRRKGEWRDRHEVTGPDGGPIQVNISSKDSQL